VSKRILYTLPCWNGPKSIASGLIFFFMQRRRFSWLELLWLLVPAGIPLIAGGYFYVRAREAKTDNRFGIGVTAPALRTPFSSMIVSPNGSDGDTRITACFESVEASQPGRYYFFSRRLTAFDGKQTRLVWSDYSVSLLPHLLVEVGGGAGPGRRVSDICIFELQRVPRSWGALTFSDEVLISATPFPGSTMTIRSVSPGTLNKLAQEGGELFRGHVLVRAGLSEQHKPDQNAREGKTN
jgi:hypothetical protein